MSTSGQPPVPAPNEQIRELMQFLREENEANRRAVRDDATASRELLKHTVWLVALPIGALIIVVGWFGFKSVTDLKETLENQAKQSTEAEITRLRGDIDNRLNLEFQTPALQRMVKTTAAEYTKNAAGPLIKGEVAAQVKSRVDAERPAISVAVSQQTHAAVKQMEPQIKSTIQDSVESEVRTTVTPLKQSIADLKTEVQPLGQSIEDLKAKTNIEHIVTRMKSDDGAAFDQAISLVNQTTIDSETRTFLTIAISDVIEGHESSLRMARTFTSPHTEEQSLSELSNGDPLVRITALDALGASPKLKLSKLGEMAASDASLNVRCVAAEVFKVRTKQKFPCLIGPAILVWWEANKQNFPDMK